MLKWFLKFLWNMGCIVGIATSLVYILDHGGKPYKQIDTHTIKPATVISTDKRESDEMMEYMYNVWLPVTTVVIMH
ncbi:hypothetical protein [Brevibacillus panacihumi]|uniref:hypothetical protein n=1 Tax=Brevibacillus panacihumi TaxID=497735 RepID=UPI003D210583